MNRRPSNLGDECYWNKTWKTNCATRLEVYQHYREKILMKHDYSEQNGHNPHLFGETEPLPFL